MGDIDMRLASLREQFEAIVSEYNGPDKGQEYDCYIHYITCQGCGKRIDAEYAYEHYGECPDYRQSLIDPEWEF